MRKSKEPPAPPPVRRVAAAYSVFWAAQGIGKPFWAWTPPSFDKSPRFIERGNVAKEIDRIACAPAEDGGRMWSFETEPARTKFLKLFGGEAV